MNINLGVKYVYVSAKSCSHDCYLQEGIHVCTCTCISLLYYVVVYFPSELLHITE